MKRWGLRGLGGKRGFSLIELLVVISVLAILAGITIIGTSGVLGATKQVAYKVTKNHIELAVGDYMIRTKGELPTTTGAIQIDGTDYYIVDMCALHYSYNGSDGPGMLRDIPVSCMDTTIDNCDGTACGNIRAEGGNCNPDAHYVWAVNDLGIVKSACKGTDCNAENADGYQSIYP